MLALGQKILDFELKTGEISTIKLVQLSDAEAIRDMKDDHSSEDGPILESDKANLSDVMAWLEQSVSKIEKGEYLLCYAFLENRIIGECSIERKEGSSSHLGELGISTIKDFRKQGVGTALLRAAEILSKDVGIKTIILTTEDINSASQGLYKKLGYEYYGKLPNAYLRGKQYIGQVLMYKEIK